MKKIILSAAIVSTMFLASCGPSKKDAISYNDQFIGIQKSLIPAYDGFINQIDGHNMDSLKVMYGEFSAKSASALEESQKAQPFAGKTDYKDAAVEYFKTLNSLAQNEGKQILDILSKDTAQITPDDGTNLTLCAGKFDSEYARVFQKIQDAQMAFSKEWKFDVEESK